MATAVQTRPAVDYARMSFAALEKTIEHNLDAAEEHFHQAVLALIQVRERALWHPKYRSFSAYIRERFGGTRQRAHQLLNHLEVVLNLQTSTAVDVSEPIPERHTRVISQLSELEQEMAYRAAQAIGGGKATLSGVEQAAKILSDTADIEDEEEKKAAQEAAIQEWLKEEQNKPAHATQRQPHERTIQRITDVATALERVKPEHAAEVGQAMLQLMESFAKKMFDKKSQERREWHAAYLNLKNSLKRV